MVCVFVWIYQNQVLVSAGPGVSLCLALSWIHTYSNAPGLSGPCCPNYRCLLYIKRSAWFTLSAVEMRALSSLMTTLATDNLEAELQKILTQYRTYSVGFGPGCRHSGCWYLIFFWMRIHIYSWLWPTSQYRIWVPVLDVGWFCITATERDAEKNNLKQNETFFSLL